MSKDKPISDEILKALLEKNEGLRNDSNLTVVEMAKLMRERGVELRYRDFVMVVEKAAIEDIRQYWQDLPPAAREETEGNAHAAMERVYPALEGLQVIDRQQMNDFYADLIIWSVAQEFKAIKQ